MYDARSLTHSPQKYIMPLTLRRVRTTARRTWRHATRLDSISSVVTKMQANASMMLRYSSSIMIWRVEMQMKVLVQCQHFVNDPC